MYIDRTILEMDFINENVNSYTKTEAFGPLISHKEKLGFTFDKSSEKIENKVMKY